MNHLGIAAAAGLALVSTHAHAQEIEFFNAPLTGGDDALTREVIAGESGEAGALFFAGEAQRAYGLAVRTGGSQREGSDVFTGSLGAAVSLRDLPLTPSLDVTLYGNDLFDSGRVGSSDLSLSALWLNLRGLQSTVSATAGVGPTDTYGAATSLKYRLPRPNVNASVRLGYRRADSQDGYAFLAAAGYGVALPALQHVSLTLSLSGAGASFDLAPSYSGRATLEYRLRKVIVGAGAATALWKGAAPYTYSGYLGYSL